jgi:hypothetical protein
VPEDRILCRIGRCAVSAAKSLLLGTLLGIGLCGWGVWGQDGGRPPAADKQGREEIDKLIRRLGSDDFRVREDATRRLKELDEALPALREAAKSRDAEVAKRAREVIEAIGKRQAKREVERGIALLKQGKTDRFVEWAVRRRERLDEDCWKAALEHAQAIADAAGKASGCKFKAFPGVELAKLIPPVELGNGIQRRRVAAEEVVVDAFIQDSFLVCSGGIQTNKAAAPLLQRCVVFANGDIKVGDKDWPGVIDGSLLVCDGDVAASVVSDSILLAAGSVSIGGGARNSAIVSGGTVRVDVEFPGARAKNSLIQEHQRDPLHCVHFFDPAKAGIEVKACRNGLRVVGIAAALAFGRAGVRQGDEVMAVDGRKVDSAEAFRRVLRRRMGDSNPVLLDLRREDKPLRIEVRGLGDAT